MSDSIIAAIIAGTFSLVAIVLQWCLSQAHKRHFTGQSRSAISIAKNTFYTFAIISLMVSLGYSVVAGREHTDTIVSMFTADGSLLLKEKGYLCPVKRDLVAEDKVELRASILDSLSNYLQKPIQESTIVKIKNERTDADVVDRHIVKITPLSSGFDRHECVIAMSLNTRRLLKLPLEISNLDDRKGHRLRLVVP